MSTELCTAIYVVLFISATVQVLVELVGLSYWLAFGIIMVLSAAKAVLVAVYLRHPRFESRPLTYLVCIGLMAALALTLVASYSLL